MTRRLSVAFIFAVIMSAAVFSQTQDGVVKSLNSPKVDFPAEAKNYIYGESVKVLINVDPKGKVKEAVVYGPLTPCSNLKDPVVTAIQKAAKEAALASLFEPILKGGKPVETGLMLTYKFPVDPSPPENKGQIINGGVVNGKALFLPKPSYPSAARSSRRAGTIEVDVFIDEKGNVISAGIKSGHPDFFEGMPETACKSRFSTTTLASRPVKVRATITYNFTP